MEICYIGKSLNLKLCLFLLQEEYRLCFEALNIYIESTNVYANF